MVYGVLFMNLLLQAEGGREVWPGQGCPGCMHRFARTSSRFSWVVDLGGKTFLLMLVVIAGLGRGTGGQSLVSDGTGRAVAFCGSGSVLYVSPFGQGIGIPFA